jgi:hypothetical protein
MMAIFLLITFFWKNILITTTQLENLRLIIAQCLQIIAHVIIYSLF